MSRKRILFLAEGVTMTHFVRPFALAESLDSAQYDTFFYAPARYSAYLRDKPFIVGELQSMPGERFLANLAKGAPPFPRDVIRAYVKEDREIIGRIKPDIVIGDMRPSLSISARMEGTLCAVLMNAYWSPYAKRRSIMPSVPLTRIVPPRWLGGLYRLTEPLAFAFHVGQMNDVRKEFGMPPLPPDLRLMYTDADHVLYPDIPEFVPTYDLPKNHRYVGICPWTPAAAKPDWWERMRADAKPKVFVSLGSSGPLGVFPALLKALSKLPVTVLVSNSGRVLPGTGPEVHLAGLLPFTETATEASVVVSHGGSGGLYPAIAAGTPILGIPSNADQQLSTAVLVESGAGLGVRVEEASAKRLLRALEKLLSEPQYRMAAKHWATVFGRYESGALFRDFLSQALGVAPGATS